MKITTIKYALLLGLLAFFIACSTKKNNFVSRNSHALSTKYNILYNGGIALDKGIEDLKLQYNDNFWEMLPVERMQIVEQTEDVQTKNENFDRAEEKATKAIQKHSMNIDGGEKNFQMDEAHLMLGKSRYYGQRFVPALEAFNYVLYKYPTSDKIYEVKIWREKTNMRMDNDALAITNLRKLLKEIKFKDQIFADANATLAQAFLNLKEKDSAIAKLKIATKYTKLNEEKARYRFILGQVYNDLGYKDSAFASFQDVINMKRKSSRNYVIQAHAKQAQLFDFKNGDTIVFLEKYKKLLLDRENRPFLDVINHQMGLYYDKQKNNKNATKFYNASLRSNSNDQYLRASNYRNLAEIYFNRSRYVTAGNYFDSTLVSLKPRTREFNLITKKRANLQDVIKYEGIAQTNDSILRIAAMSSTDRNLYYENYITKLKKEDEIKLKLAEKEALLQEKIEAISGGNFKTESNNPNLGDPYEDNPIPSLGNKTATSGSFYFYNPASVAFGKITFQKKWGKRALVENWRLSSEKKQTSSDVEDAEDISNQDVAENSKETDERYTTLFYTKNIPTSTKVLDSLSKERNFAYYQLGVIYKEKFKEYQRSAEKLEKLLVNNPEERLILPAMYNLYKVYEIIDKDKAQAMKAKILSLYPDSRYAQIISNPSANSSIASSPDAAYDVLYKQYEKGLYRETLSKTELAIDQFTGEEIVPKLELLKANLVGKLKGLEEYKKALNYVALTYPNSEEGKNSEIFSATKIPYLESLTLNSELPKSWKIIYESSPIENDNSKKLTEKLTKFAKERTVEKLLVSTDVYTMDKNFIVIHGIKSKESALGITQVLKEFKEYKITEKPTIISNENYEVVQIKKNFDEYVIGDWLNKEIIPTTKNIVFDVNKEESKTKLTSKEEVKNAMSKVKVEEKGGNNTLPSSNNSQNQIQKQNQQTKDGGKINAMPPGMAQPTSNPRN